MKKGINSWKGIRHFILGSMFRSRGAPTVDLGSQYASAFVQRGGHSCGQIVGRGTAFMTVCPRVGNDLRLAHEPFRHEVAHKERHKLMEGHTPLHSGKHVPPPVQELTRGHNMTASSSSRGIHSYPQTVGRSTDFRKFCPGVGDDLRIVHEPSRHVVALAERHKVMEGHTPLYASKHVPPPVELQELP